MTEDMRIGHGYDVHRLVSGRALILGGVTVPHTMGLLGHSDADVLSHAVADSILGALALGDIGGHFPDSDPLYRGADSIGLLKLCADMARRQGWRTGNLDATIIAQAPRLAPYIPAMRQILADAMGTGLSRISVKATTEEGLGFTGMAEGIAAHSVILLVK